MPSLAALLALPRPEYAKQVEMVLVDLLWKSPGSTLGAADAIKGLPKKRDAGRPATRRLVVMQERGDDPNVTETSAWALEAAGQGLFTDPLDAQRFAAAALQSISAPRSRGDRSRTAVPVHRGVLPLQTLNGAVNKDQPPDLAAAVELMSVLGGAHAVGDAAAMVARALDDLAGSDIDRFFEHVAPVVWQREANDQLEAWPAQLQAAGPFEASEFSGACQAGPPRWFWRNWQKLLDPANEWRAALPDRRFMDWATCLLRTGLALTYLWEAAVFRALRDFRTDGAPASWARLQVALSSPVLLTLYPQATPVSERDIASLLSSGLGDGYHARAWFQEAHDEDDLNPGGLAFEVSDDPGVVHERLRLVGGESPDDGYRNPRQAPKTMREFVRYLLLARASNDASPDQADFYYLARGDRQRIWVEPGPEWLVVMASLSAGRPGGQCTLRDVLEELRELGLRVDRATLVGLLEGAGLTQDSPDADDAIIVSAGF